MKTEPRSGRRQTLVLVLALFCVLGPVRTAAHPHVSAVMTIDVVFNEQGAIAALRHRWTFDEIFSAAAVSKVGSREGSTAPEPFAAMADKYIASMKPYDYFTYGRANGEKVAFAPPTGQRLMLVGGLLSLQFTLPLISPVSPEGFEVIMYDKTYFVQLNFSPQDPVNLIGAEAGCRYEVESPAPPKNVDESFFNGLGQTSNWAEQFARRFFVRCSAG